MIVTLAIFALFLIAYLWLKKRENFWKERNFPSANFQFPFGSMNGIGTKTPFCLGLDEFYKEFKHKGPAVGFFSFTNPVLLPIDPNLIKHILVTDFDSFHDRALYYNKRDDPISGHLLALQGKEWKERRAMITPTFTSGKMKIMFEIIDIIGDELFKSMTKSLYEDGNVLEMHEIVAQFTTDAISNVAFGMNSDSLNNPNSSMRKYGKEILNFGIFGFLKFLFTSSFPELSRKLHLTANKRCVMDFFFNTFKANIEHRENNNVYRKDFLQILLELKRKNSLTVEELAAESFIFFLGGK
jgi:cytochrome P450 family 6